MTRAAWTRKARSILVAGKPINVPVIDRRTGKAIPMPRVAIPLPKPRKRVLGRLIASEAQEQAAVISWWDAYSRTKGLDSRLLFAIPNGAHLAGDARMRAIQMVKLKRTGLRKGLPDLFLALPCGPWSGMFLEMKSMSGRTSPDQRSFHALLADYRVAISHGSVSAIQMIKAYVERALA